MLNAEFSEKDGLLSLKVKGHAGQADRGKDIVCSAASMLAYTLAQCVSVMSDEGLLDGAPVISLKEGRAKVVARPQKTRFSEVLHAYWVIQTGFALLARAYPEFAAIKQFGNADGR